LGATPDAERRQLTVMFCDLVNSAALSAQLDPEDLGDVMAAFQRCVSEVMRQFDGHIAKYMGDGVRVYFGYPRAHEDDAERAVRASLALVEAVGQLRTCSGTPQVRAGIATGLVVVGDLTGSGEPQERGVVGETPTLATRLQGLAEPNSIVISLRTHQLLGDLFEYRDLGAVKLKGFAEPVCAWQILGESKIQSRFEALRSGRIALVGRQEEIELLLESWQHARDGRGQVVLIRGEAGIGKSRIAAALLEQISDNIQIRLQCSPHHTGSALYPLIRYLEWAAGLEHGDTTDRKLDKLETLLATGSSSSEDVGLLAELLAIPAHGKYPPLNLSPPKRKRRTLQAVVRHLQGLTRQKPVLMLFEDTHWIDATSQELLDLTVDRVSLLPVLMIVTHRPEFVATWGGKAHVTSLQLARLSARQSATLVQEVAGDMQVSPELTQQIVARADGVPLFIEELTKTVLASGLIRKEKGQYILTSSPQSFSVPTSLRDSLTARLDQLPRSLRELAQAGATIGREFSFELLAAVSNVPHDSLRDALAQLREAELIFAHRQARKTVYTFKHALVQDAVYETLLKSTRRQLHDRIAMVLETRYPGVVEREPEVLAHHHAEAGSGEKAVGYYLKAAGLALARSATTEASTHLRKGLAMLGSFADEALRRRHEIDLQLLLAQVFITAKGFAAPEAGSALTRAHSLSKELGDTARSYATLASLWGHWLVRGEHESGLRAARQLVSITQLQTDGSMVGELMIGELATGTSLLALGIAAEARHHLERAVALSERSASRSCMFFLGFAANVGAHAWLAVALIYLGYLDRGLACCRRAVAMARDLNHPFTTAFAYSMGSKCLSWAGRDRTQRKWIDAVIKIADDHGFAFFTATGMLLRGALLAKSDSPQQALKLATEGLRAFRATGQNYQVAMAAECYVSACEAAGKAECGLDVLSDTLAQMHVTGEREGEPEIYRMRGRLLLLLRQRVAAEGSFQTALALAQESRAKFWRLRAALDLARLWCSQGRRAEAVALLASVYGEFTEGFDAPDLKQVKALLDEIGAGHPVLETLQIRKLQEVGALHLPLAP
jgi:class 3 adenylate cyclase/tetratricopeptide (TPR) repeat protein